jgi:plasmid stabilization system protein ParE
VSLRRVRFTAEARSDLVGLYDYLLDRDLAKAAEALEAIQDSLQLAARSPFTCRRAAAADPFLRELVIPFGTAGYVALFRIERTQVLTVLAVRHQREDDFSR